MYNFNHFNQGRQMFYYPPKIFQNAYRKNHYDQATPYFSVNAKTPTMAHNMQMPYGLHAKNMHRNEKQIENQLRSQIHKLKNKNLSHPGYKIRPSHDVFEEDIQLVHQGKNGKGSIYVGNLQAAQNLQTLKRLNIGSLLTACKGVHIRHSAEHVPHYLYIPGQDHQLYNIADHFPQAISFIKNSLQKTNILVHCMAGISRSISLVLAYLMKEQGMSYEQAFGQVKRRRRIMNPNRGFVKQLKHFERSISSYEKNHFQPHQIRHSMHDLNRSLVNIRNPDLVNIRQRCKSPETVSKNNYQKYFVPENKTYKNLNLSSVNINVDNMRSSSVQGLRNLRENRALLHQNIQRGKFFSTVADQKKYSQQMYSKDPQNQNESVTKTLPQNNFANKNFSNNQQSHSKKNISTTQLSNYKEYKQLNKELQQKIQAIKSKYQQYTRQLTENRYKHSGNVSQNIKNPNYNSLANNENFSPSINRYQPNVYNNINIHRRLNNPPSQIEAKYYYDRIQNNKNLRNGHLQKYSEMQIRNSYDNYNRNKMSFGQKIRGDNFLIKQKN